MTDQPGQNQTKLSAIVGLIILLSVAALGYLYWASNRVSDDLAEREARAQELIDEFEATQDPVRNDLAERDARAQELIDEFEATEDPAAAPEAADSAVPAELAAVPVELAPQPGEVLVVNRVPGDDYGRLAIRHVDGSRTLLERSCVRVHLAGERGICLSEQDTVVPSYLTTFFDASNPALEVKSYPSALPSRARISPGGTTSSVTAFVSGTSYADVGSGASTTLVTIDDIDGPLRIRGANQMTVESNNDRYAIFDAQFWGMTFVDEDEFYITGFYGGDPEIMRGRLSDMTLHPTDWIGSCPSVSPDGKTVVYKEDRGNDEFNLVAVDVATGDRWTLGETRSVDDQVEWLDDDTILYSLHPEGGDNPVQPEFDIWMLDIAQDAEPELFLPNADSPAVAR